MRSLISNLQIIDQNQSSGSKLRRLRLTPAAIATFVFGLVASIAFNVSVAQAQSDASQIALQHPGWVRVPGALVRPDCVHQIPQGAGPRIENGLDTGDVSLNGFVIAHYDPCPEDATIRFAEETGESSVITNSTGSGLVEASYWDDTSLGSSDNMDEVANTLTVPSKPSKNGGVILLYNGLEDSTGKYLFSPTLQYGKNAGEGGNYWTIVTYFVTPGTTYLSPAEKVNGGDSLSLFTYIFSKSGSTYTWLMEVQDLTTNAFTFQNDTSTGLHWNFAISGALAVGNLSSCSEFPATKAVFTGTFVDHGFPSYNKLSPKWVGATYAYGGPSCGFKVTPGNTSTLTY
jgi:hypothetical protein